MKTEQKLALKLKELMSNEPLDQITVSRLTKVCGVNRQTFYYHFRDIYDLLTWIFLNESIQEIETASNYKEALYARRYGERKPDHRLRYRLPHSRRNGRKGNQGGRCHHRGEAL